MKDLVSDGFAQVVKPYIDAQDKITRDKFLSVFANKSICIVGDSISDETTYQPNWVDAFTEILTAADIGATVTNATITGASLVGFGSDVSKIPLNHDIYIFALGVNDFQGQFSANDIRQAVFAIVQRINLHDADRRAFYISPLKAFRSEYQNYKTHLSAYRHFCETLFAEIGFTVISGDNMPNLNSFTESTYLADKLHPASIFRYIYADYVISAIISGISTFSKGRGWVKQLEFVSSFTRSAGTVTLRWVDGATAILEFNLVGAELIASTWVDVCYIPAPGAYGLLNNVISPVMSWTGQLFQVRFVNGVLQLAAPSTGSFTISGYVPAYVQTDNSVA